jgi:hypothetical protein
MVSRARTAAGAEYTGDGSTAYLVTTAVWALSQSTAIADNEVHVYVDSVYHKLSM